MYEALKTHTHLSKLTEAAPRSCLVTTMDGHSANMRCMTYMFQLIPATCLGLHIQCFHHICSLILAPITRELDLVCPLFCAVKVLQNADLVDYIKKTIRDILDKELVWQRDSAQDPDDAVYAEAALHSKALERLTVCCPVFCYIINASWICCCFD